MAEKKASKVKRSFQKTGRTPSEREIHSSHIPATKMPKGLSPLAAYIEENLETGISVKELIEQFQEYDCEHKEMILAWTTSEKKAFRCTVCDKIVIRLKPGVKAT